MSEIICADYRVSMADKPIKIDIPDKPFHLEMPAVETGGCSILMCGSGRSGKTTALKYIIDNYMKKHCGVIFSNSSKAHAYKEMKYPLLPLSNAYIPELINTAYRINKETKNHYPFLFVIDDVPLARNDKELMKTTTIYRNSGISLIHCAQSPNMISPTCRSNYTFFMLFHNNSSEQAENSCKFFLRGRLPNKWTMNQKVAWLQKATEDHHFILINNWTGDIMRCKIDLD
jgi:hypothetical protein